MNISTEKKKVIILKIGGSVITQKHREGTFIRRTLLARIATEIQATLKKNPHIRPIIIHGAGAGGLANKIAGLAKKQAPEVAPICLCF